MRLRLDSLEYSWSRWVLSYDEATQLQFLEQLVGASRLRWLPAIMVILVVLVLSAVAFGNVFKVRRRRDPVVDVCLNFMNTFAGTRLERLPGEGAQTYFQRLATVNPLYLDELESCARDINKVMYQSSNDPHTHVAKNELGVLSQRLRRLRRQLARSLTKAQI
jgi:HAMP domain-containing protein